MPKAPQRARWLKRRAQGHAAQSGVRRRGAPPRSPGATAGDSCTINGRQCQSTDAENDQAALYLHITSSCCILTHDPGL